MTPSPHEVRLSLDARDANSLVSRIRILRSPEATPAKPQLAYLFLDVDGVLHHYEAATREKWFERRCMLELQRIVHVTGCVRAAMLLKPSTVKCTCDRDNYLTCPLLAKCGRRLSSPQRGAQTVLRSYSCVPRWANWDWTSAIRLLSIMCASLIVLFAHVRLPNGVNV